MQIGKVVIPGHAALAPMAGAADRAARAIAREYGAAYAVGEMVSAKGIVSGSKKSAELLRCDGEARPYAVQLFGNAPDCMAEAARVAEAFGPDILDLNFGCPAPKVTSTGAGSALLRDLALAASIVSGVVRAVAVPVTVKFRKGYGAQDDVAAEAARMFEAAGAAALCVHGRTRAQMYAPPADLACIAAAKAAVSIPVIGNGDVFTPQDAKNMFGQTGCDLVMVGRGALGNPFLFGQIEALLSGNPMPPSPAPEERLAVMRREIALLLADKGEFIGFREARRHAAWYMTGFRGAPALRRMCGRISGWPDIDAICEAALKENKGCGDEDGQIGPESV